MRIAVSADSFSSFTSGFPVRGMMLSLIQMRQNDSFVLYYSSVPSDSRLADFYNEINNLPNVEVRYLTRKGFRLKLARVLGWSVEDLDPSFDVFIDPGKPEFWKGGEGKAICSLADLSTIRGYATGKYSWFFKYWNRIKYKKVLSRVRYICAISEFTRDDILSEWPQFSEKVKVVHNGIEDFWFKTDDTESVELPFTGEYFIWWGLISRRKNISLLIDCYKELKSQDPSLPKLLLIGKVEPYLMDEIMGKLDKDVILIPFQDNEVLKELVKNSAGLIFPSFYEGFGLPVIEAFSQGVNVACSNCTSLPEVAGGHAFLFDPNDKNGICEAILSLKNGRSNPDELMEYSKKFTYEKAAVAYSDLIDSIY